MSKNPFANKPNTQTAARPANNPFAGSNDLEDRLPIMAGGITARGKLLAYRITPKAANSGTYVYVDLELLEVPIGEDAMHKPGAKVTHRLGGFESMGAQAALRSLKELNLAIRPELVDREGVDFDALPLEMAESEEILGREIWIRTEARATRTIDQATGKPRSIVKGQYSAV